MKKGKKKLKMTTWRVDRKVSFSQRSNQWRVPCPYESVAFFFFVVFLPASANALMHMRFILPVWADSGSPPGHICDHRLLLTLWWLGAQSPLQSPAFIFDPRLSPGRRTKHGPGVPPPSHSKPWPPGCLGSCPHWEIKSI